jgi:hypothetical protein
VGCPVHIWLPAMGAALPFARVARDRVKVAGSRLRPRRGQPAESMRTVQRWPAVGAAAASVTSEDEPSA